MTRWQPTHCPVCRRLLVHRVGAATLLCPSCHSLLSLHGHPSTPGQTVCLNCTNIIHHPIGPPLLQCRICTATNPTPVLRYTCRVCSLYLAYSSTLPAVFCPVCHTVEPPIDSPPSRLPVLLPLNHDAPPRPCPPLPPKHFPWLPSTPLRPVPVPPRSPHFPPSSLPVSPGPISQPYHSLQFTPPQPPASSPTSSPETHHQQPYQSEPLPQPPHTGQSPRPPHTAPLNGDNLSINGGGSNDNPLDDSNQQATQTPTTLPLPPKSVKKEDVDTSD